MSLSRRFSRTRLQLSEFRFRLSDSGLSFLEDFELFGQSKFL